jgi:DNA polymerase III epsilon subunit family exonuclease
MDQKLESVGGVELRRDGSLVERVRAALVTGPLPTALIATNVLGLRGGERAAAAFVFSLLGTDSRFSVDATGLWSLAFPPAALAANSLREEEWVVVDVETTGGSPDHGHRVTEVAAVWVSRGRVTETFSTLINPERRIPSMITSLTGITDAMVAGAPPFRDVAPHLTEVLRGRVFVAHNASFDWRFVGAELDRTLGYRLEGRQLCTVRLARKLLPHLPSRALGALADYFGLEMESHHRALDDAVATAELLIRFFDILGEREITHWQAVEQLLRNRAPRRKRRAMPRSMDSA